MIAGSQTIADDRRQPQTIAEDRTWFYLLRSSAITIAGSQTIANDRRSGFPYDRRRSQNFLRSTICDSRSSAIIWKQALKQSLNAFTLIRHRFNFDSTCFNTVENGGEGGREGGRDKNVAVQQNRTYFTKK